MIIVSVGGCLSTRRLAPTVVDEVEKVKARGSDRVSPIVPSWAKLVNSDRH